MLQADSKSYIDTHVVLIVESDNNDSKYTFLQGKVTKAYIYTATCILLGSLESP